ncbi:response regulator transcription factor [Turicimonas muris]|uniref:response regulator transcription factor n=1 Tax=Turicimonas muris TaxID=1796652 RepID=UPI00321FEA56
MKKNKVEPLIRIVDDEASMRRALKILLEMEGWKVTCYSSAKEFLAEDAPSVPGCVILDVSMPEMTGLQLHSLLVEREYECPIIFLTGHGDIEMAVDSMKKGAVDFLQKPINEEKLLSAIAKAIDWDLSHRGWTVSQEEEMARYESLSKREKEVIGFVAKGLINKEIAQRLGLSERTIEVHRLSATKKLKLNAPADIATLISHLEQV